VFDLAVTSTRILTPDGPMPATVVISGGIIRGVERGGPVARSAEHLHVGDAAVMPGIVDTHVHVNEPGRTDWEGFATATRAAAAGGVTTIVDMPLNCVPVTTTVAALQAKLDVAAGQAMVDYGLWGGVVPGNRADLEPLVGAGVLGFKCFLVPSGVPEFEPVTEADLEAAMHVVAKLGMPLLVHAELPGPIQRATQRLAAADPRRYHTHLASRPREAEGAAIGLVVRLVGGTGCAAHIVHLSSADALDHLARARQAGLPVTVETCPHYLTFTAERIPDGATVFKCAPPIREAENRERLWEGLRARTIDLIASDHSPAPPELKCLESGDFTRAWGGIGSLQLVLPATWSAARERGFTLADLTRWLCEQPSRLAGLGRQKGRIAPGYDADLVVWNPEATFAVDPGRLYHRHPANPYARMTLFGVVLQTFVRGQRVYDCGMFPSAPAGRLVRRDTS
jgi:allantoinase